MSDVAQGRIEWYWNRLRCMSVPEALHRGAVLSYVRLQQLKCFTADTPPPPNLTSPAKNFIVLEPGVERGPYSIAADRILQGRMGIFALADAEVGHPPRWNRDPLSGTEVPLFYGKTLNYRDTKLVGDIKYLWELNRHLQFVTLAQAYCLTRAPRYLDGLRTQLTSWFEQCPYLRGPNWTSSLELSIRLINWSIAWQLVGGINSPAFADPEGERFRDQWLASIYQHMHFVRGHFSRFSSANNHLIGEAAGLYVATVVWPFWKKTSTWREVAKGILTEETLRQNAADGVNREQAISYQQFVLDFLIVAALAGRVNGDAFSVQYLSRIEAMLEFVAAMMDVGGRIPMIGDADDGYVMRLSQESNFCPYRSLLATGANLFKRGAFGTKAGGVDDKTRWLLSDQRLNLISSEHAMPLRRVFPEGGYYVLGSDFDTAREIRLIVDAGPLGYQAIAAHGHADALALTLSARGREFLIDPGTYAYHTKKRWRDYFRGTRAHNTVVVDGQDQSTSGGNFMWVQKARAVCELWESSEQQDHFVGAHDGYQRLQDPVTHRREIVFSKFHQEVFVTDTLTCANRHTVETCWHFSEDCAVSVEGKTVLAENSGVQLRLRPSAVEDIIVLKGEESPIGGWISRRFDIKVPTTTIVCRSTIKGTAAQRTVIAVND